MHELSVTENILEISLRHAVNANASRVKDIYIVIGQLSSLVDDSIQFYWDIISKDTIAENATLHFTRIPVKLLCLDCNQTYTPQNENLVCTACKSKNIKVIAGREFYLEAIEIEEISG